MRGRDNQLIYYATGWGNTVSQEPYLKDIVAGNWEEMLSKRRNGSRRRDGCNA